MYRHVVVKWLTFPTYRLSVEWRNDTNDAILWVNWELLQRVSGSQAVGDLRIRGAINVCGLHLWDGNVDLLRSVSCPWDYSNCIRRQQSTGVLGVLYHAYYDMPQLKQNYASNSSTDFPELMSWRIIYQRICYFKVSFLTVIKKTWNQFFSENKRVDWHKFYLALNSSKIWDNKSLRFIYLRIT